MTTSEMRAPTETKPGDKSTAELVHDLTNQLSHLARTEVQLATRELKSKAKHAGLGAATAGIGGVLAFYGGATLVAGLVLVLALVMPAWVAAFVVAGAVLLLAGIAVLVAKGQLRKSAPMPSAAVESTKEDIQAIKEAAKQ
jgi:membrane protein